MLTGKAVNTIGSEVYRRSTTDNKYYRFTTYNSNMTTVSARKYVSSYEYNPYTEMKLPIVTNAADTRIKYYIKV